jgi:hypothetical protein
MHKMLRPISKLRYPTIVVKIICIALALCILPIMADALNMETFSEEDSICPKQLIIPLYAAYAQRALIQGTVECEIFIVKGQVRDVTFTDGNPVLRELVKPALLQWVYAVDLTTKTKLTFVFHLLEQRDITCTARLILPYEVHIYAVHPGPMIFQ